MANISSSSGSVSRAPALREGIELTPTEAVIVVWAALRGHITGGDKRALMTFVRDASFRRAWKSLVDRGILVKSGRAWRLGYGVLAGAPLRRKARRVSVERYMTAVDAAIDSGLAGLASAYDLALQHAELADAGELRDAASSLTAMIRGIAAKIVGPSRKMPLNGKSWNEWRRAVFPWVAFGYWKRDAHGPPPDEEGTKAPMFMVEAAISLTLARMIRQPESRSFQMALKRARWYDAYGGRAICRS